VVDVCRLRPGDLGGSVPAIGTPSTLCRDRGLARGVRLEQSRGRTRGAGETGPKEKGHTMQSMIWNQKTQYAKRKGRHEGGKIIYGILRALLERRHQKCARQRCGAIETLNLDLSRPQPS
jgi:hypothetical protein